MASELAAALVKGEKETEGVHYKIDEKQKSVLMTEEGYEAAENCLGVSNLIPPTPPPPHPPASRMSFCGDRSIIFGGNFRGPTYKRGST
jgi:hypothetical protein